MYYDSNIYLLANWGAAGNSIFLFITGWFLVKFEDLAAGGGTERFSAKKYYLKKFLRLWPSYFVSVSITMVAVSIFGLPGRECSFYDYLLNAFWLNGFLNTSYVDGAHWYMTTIVSVSIVTGILHKHQVEKLPYPYLAWAIACTVSGGVSRFIGGSYASIIILSVALKALLSIKNKHVNAQNAFWVITGVVAFLSICIRLGSVYLITTIIAALLVLLAHSGILKFLDNKVLLWIAGLSYPLYLIHQNIAFVIEYQLMSYMGTYSWWYGLIALCVVIPLGWIISKYVEKPVNKIVRDRL